MISDDATRLDADAVHAYLARSYWAEGIPREIVARSLENSLCVGIYAGNGYMYDSPHTGARVTKRKIYQSNYVVRRLAA